jgi:hypothetical protein
VLPVYFVTTPAYDSGSPDPEGLVSKLHDRIFLDFRDLRIRGTDDREYRQAILKAAARVADLLTASAALVSANPSDHHRRAGAARSDVPSRGRPDDAP